MMHNMLNRRHQAQRLAHLSFPKEFNQDFWCDRRLPLRCKHRLFRNPALFLPVCQPLPPQRQCVGLPCIPATSSSSPGNANTVCAQTALGIRITTQHNMQHNTNCTAHRHFADHRACTQDLADVKLAADASLQAMIPHFAQPCNDSPFRCRTRSQVDAVEERRAPTCLFARPLGRNKRAQCDTHTPRACRAAGVIHSTSPPAIVVDVGRLAALGRHPESNTCCKRMCMIVAKATTPASTIPLI